MDKEELLTRLKNKKDFAESRSKMPYIPEYEEGFWDGVIQGLTIAINNIKEYSKENGSTE